MSSEDESVKNILSRIDDVDFYGPQLSPDFHAFFKDILYWLRERTNELGPLKITNQDEQIDFARYCHDGWKTAQSLILQKILKNLDEIQRLEVDIAKLHGLKDWENKKRSVGEKSELNLEILILRRCLDHIPWMMLGADHSAARRLAVQGGENNFSAVNIRDALPVANEINKDPDKIAILCDATTFIHVSDLLVLDLKKGRTEFIEIKSGRKNIALTHIAAATYADEEARKTFTAALNKKDRQHFNRIRKQIIRSENVRENLSLGKGHDNFSGGKFRAMESNLRPVFFSKEIMAAYEKIQAGKSWAIDVIDECLFLGLYAHPGQGLTAFSGWLELMKCNGAIVNITDSFPAAQTRPFTTLDLSADLLTDLLSGKVFLLMSLDLEKLADVANKSLGDILFFEEKLPGHSDSQKIDHLKLGERSLSIRVGDETYHPGLGLTDRMFFDLQRPLSVISMMQEARSKP